MNLIQVQDQLKMLSDQQLQQELKAGDPSTQALVMSEVSRRQRLRAMSQPKPQKSIYEQMLGAPVPPLPPGMPGATPGAAPAAGQPPAGLAGALPSAPGPSMPPPPMPGLASGGEVSQATPGFWDRLMHPVPEGALSPAHIANAATNLPGPDWQQMWESFVNAWRDKQADAQPKPVPVQHYATSGVVKDLSDDAFGSQADLMTPGDVEQMVDPNTPDAIPGPQWQVGGTNRPEQPLFGEPEYPFPTNTATPNMAGQPNYVSVKPAGGPTSSYEETYGPMANTINDKYGLPKGLLHSIAQQESGFNPLAVGQARGDDSLGITQIREKYAQNTYGINPADRIDPAKSLEATGNWFHNKLAGGMPLRDVIAAYNGSGPDAQKYADKVLALMNPPATPTGTTVASTPSGVGGFNDFVAQLKAHGIGAETPLDPSKFKVDPATVGAAPRADYAAAKARAEAMYGPDAGNDDLQRQLDELKAASGPHQLSLGDRLILFGQGMRNPWDVAGGIGNQFNTQRQEDDAARERAFKMYGLESNLQDRRQRRQEDVLREAGAMASNEQTAGMQDWLKKNQLAEEGKSADLQAAVYNNQLGPHNMQEIASAITAMSGLRGLDQPTLMDLVTRKQHGDKDAAGILDQYMDVLRLGKHDPNVLSANEQAILAREAVNDAHKRLNDFIAKESDMKTNMAGAQAFQKLSYEQKRDKYLEQYPEDRQHLGAPITIPYNEIPGS